MVRSLLTLKIDFRKKQKIDVNTGICFYLTYLSSSNNVVAGHPVCNRYYNRKFFCHTNKDEKITAVFIVSFLKIT